MRPKMAQRGAEGMVTPKMRGILQCVLDSISKLFAC